MTQRAPAKLIKIILSVYTRPCVGMFNQSANRERSGVNTRTHAIHWPRIRGFALTMVSSWRLSNLGRTLLLFITLISDDSSMLRCSQRCLCRFQFNLVCGWQSLVQLASTLYMAGSMTGSLVSGAVSDRWFKNNLNVGRYVIVYAYTRSRATIQRIQESSMAIILTFTLNIETSYQ